IQQRTGLRSLGKRRAAQPGIPILYYVFDLLWLEGYDLRGVALETRKQLLQPLVAPGAILRYSDHHLGDGKALMEAARQTGLEGILAKRRDSRYREGGSRDWLKIKITHTVDCVVGGYTEPEGSREYFGSIVLGQYDRKGRLIHVGQAGTGFDLKTLKDIW